MDTFSGEQSDVFRTPQKTRVEIVLRALQVIGPLVSIFHPALKTNADGAKASST